MNGTKNDLDLSELIDSKPVSRVQVRVIALCSLIALLDGVDTQSIGVAAPMIADAVRVPVAEFGPVFAAALLGAALGASLFGPLADRYGRKLLLIVSVFVFGTFTFATAFCRSYESLILVRGLAGVGLGGALPCFIALASEYAPRRLRATVVTLSWAAFPLGGMLGGFINSFVIEQFGWEAIFYIGGILPIIVAGVLVLALPGSLRQVLAFRGQSDVLRILRSMYKIPINSSTRIVVSDEKLHGLSIKHLFSHGRALQTCLLWVPFFMAFGNLIVVVLWTPTLLNQLDISPRETALVVAFNGLGAAIGMGVAGRFIEKFGTIRTLVPAFVLGALATAGLGQWAADVSLASLFTFMVGLFVGFGSAGVVALAALIYPTAIRSTGVGMAMSMGRIGQTVCPLIAGALLVRAWTESEIMLVVAAAPLISAVFVMMLAYTGSSSRTATALTVNEQYR